MGFDLPIGHSMQIHVENQQQSNFEGYTSVCKKGHFVTLDITHEKKIKYMKMAS